jgi:ubiquitin carboxyl-terminal hydrolase 9/24
MKMVLKLIQGTSYNGVMYSLNVLSVLIRRTYAAAQNKRPIWLTSARLAVFLSMGQAGGTPVLQTLLGDNLHKIQYVEKLEPVVRFLINEDKLSELDLTALWNAQVGKHESVVTNVHGLLANLAASFTGPQLDHLITCFRHTWGGTPAQMEKSLELIGRLAKDDKEGHLAQKVLELLWELVC